MVKACLELQFIPRLILIRVRMGGHVVLVMHFSLCHTFPHPRLKEVVVDSNGSGEVGQQERRSEDKKGSLEGEEDWQLREELMGAFEGALDMSGKRGDLRGIRVLKNDKVMGARSGGPCFGNCEDDDGAEWVSSSVRPRAVIRPGLPGL